MLVFFSRFIVFFFLSLSSLLDQSHAIDDDVRRLETSGTLNAVRRQHILLAFCTVKRRYAQIGAARSRQARARKRGRRQRAFEQRGPPQVGVAQRGVIQTSVRKIGVLQLGIDQIRILHVGKCEISARHVGILKVGLGERGPNKRRTLGEKKITKKNMKDPQLDSATLRLDPAKLDPLKLRREKVSFSRL